MKHQGVHDLFTGISNRCGSFVAIDSGARQVSYLDLEKRSNQIANYLMSRGIRPGAIIGIVLEDPAEVVASLLGVLKMGGVFVPLDPNFPARRLEAMAQLVQPSCYVVNKASSEKLPASIDADLVPVDTEELEAAETSAPPVERDENDPCSIYFTSGSTGVPKAILGRLKGIDHFVRWEIEALGIGDRSRVSQLASPSFDGFLKDVFVPLCAGGVTCVPEDRKIILEPARLMDWLDSAAIEVLHCVPSVLRGILNEKPASSRFPNLKWVVLAGEALPPADVRKWSNIYGDRIPLVNLYGPTETTITKLAYFVQPSDADKPSIPIGKPIRGSAAMVLSPSLEPARAGAVGEIYIRTPYRSLGYYRAPELTREAFVVNPFNNNPEDVLYRTGDFGRLLEDGNLEFLGRKDQQVKIRGVRVDLAEIENQMRKHPSVRDVAVIDREDMAGNKFLSAYVALDDDANLAELRRFLESELPEYMVPSAYTPMHQLPRTLNGKLDRKMLPAPESVANGSPYVAPQSAEEELLCVIFAEVLKRTRIGRDDSFFELGGHSLLATQVVSRVRSAYQIELPLRALFEAPTPARLLERVKTARGNADATPMPLARAGREGDIPLSYAQERMWFLDQLASGKTAYNMSLGLRMRGPLRLDPLQRSMDEIVRRHEILRTRFPEKDGHAVQEVFPEWKLEIVTVDLQALLPEEREAEARRYGQIEAATQFDLAKGPILRAMLLKVGKEDHALVVTMHHIVSDGWSTGVIAKEFSQLYAAYSAGANSPFPELPLQYADYAIWQRKWLQGDVLQKRLDYWNRQLAEVDPRLQMPQMRRRPVVQSFRGSRSIFEVPRSTGNAIRDLSRKEGTTLFMTALTAFFALLYTYTGQEDLVVGSVIANRDRAELEPLIGFLANTIVLRVDLSGGPSCRQLLKRVREVCLEGYAHQLPPEILAEERARENGNGKQGLYDVWFQVERQRQQKLELAGLEWENFRRDATEVVDLAFELSFIMFEEESGALMGRIEYDVELFDEKTIARLGQDYVRLLAMMTEDPDTSLRKISLTTAEENEDLVRAFSSSLDG
jgi:amino acid adenylation domain-containing protein